MAYIRHPSGAFRASVMYQRLKAIQLPTDQQDSVAPGMGQLKLLVRSTFYQELDDQRHTGRNSTPNLFH